MSIVFGDIRHKPYMAIFGFFFGAVCIKKSVHTTRKKPYPKKTKLCWKNVGKKPKPYADILAKYGPNMAMLVGAILSGLRTRLDQGARHPINELTLSARHRPKGWRIVHHLVEALHGRAV